MASTRNIGGFIEPWSGSGWPLSMFVDQKALTRKEIYFCARAECVERTEDGQEVRRIVREPWRLNCESHRLCKECYDLKLSLPEDQRECKVCENEPFDHDDRTQSDQVVLPDQMFVEKRFDTTEEWQLEARDCGYNKKDELANDQLDSKQVKCPYDCGITSRLTIGTIEKHMSICKERLIPCERCTEIIKFSQSAVHSATVCPFRAVDCPNKCGKKGLKGNERTKHLAECEKRPPMCNICKSSYKYNEDAHDHLYRCVANCPLNCSESSEDVNIVKHLTSEHLMGEHLLLLFSLFIEAKNAGKLTPMLDALLQLESDSDKTQRMLMEKVNHMTQESASRLLNKARLAEKNRIDLNDLEALFKVLAQDVHMLTSYDTVFRSLEDRTKKQEAETDDRLSKLETLSNVRIAEIEIQKTALLHFHMTAFNGHLIWKIDRVQQRRDEAHVKHSIYSHPFYTEVYGYKMCARIYFNGDGTGVNTHISLFFVVMKGEYDALLPWPFQQKVTMKLRNQTKKRPDVVEKFRPEPSSSSFQKPKNEMNIASGCPQFAVQSHVFSKENGFVVDDTIFIEISVDNAYEALHGLNISVQDMTRRFTSAGGK